MALYFRISKAVPVTSMAMFSSIVFLIFASFAAAGTLPVNKFVRRYEVLNYDTEQLAHRHERSRRSTSGSVRQEVHLNFDAHGREFRLRLVQDTETFDSRTDVVIDGRNSPSDFSHIYHGYVEGEPYSYVHGSIIRGIFSGRIDIRDETYYVDKSHMHFVEKQPFHSFIYSSKDVLPPPYDRHHQSSDGSSCGLLDSRIHEWMTKVQSSSKTFPDERRQRPGSLNKESSYQKYTFDANSRRSKRAADPDRRMCSLLLQSDPALWNYVKNRTGYTRSDSEAKDEITALFANHVSAIKIIYSNTTFVYGSIGPYTGITFSVHRMQINTSSICTTNPDANPFCKPNIDVSNFLNLNSLSNHDLYCLAFVFTFRDFAQGTLGLAWVGSNTRTAGGICETFKPYIENNREVYKSLNTGIVTLSNYGSRVPTKVSQLTFAHEVGHGFGSPHDSGSECVPLQNDPNNPNGNYIMYASATSGDQPNNQKFSKCSIGNMTLVIDAVMNEQFGKDNCFETPTQSFCGNRIVESSEECDCGFVDDCNDPIHPDTCCFPRDDTNTTLPQCVLKPNAACSPSVGPCCDSCSYVSASTNRSCQDATECTLQAFCNGSSAKCPAAAPQPDLTVCNSQTQVCRNGECVGSVCERLNWTVCYKVAPADDKNFDRGQLCYVSCTNPKTGECVTTGDLADLQDQNKHNEQLLGLLTDLGLQNTGIRLPSGAPCDNYRGYCDVFRKCRSVNEDGPLARLTNLLFSQQALTTIRDWITVHWWAVLLMGVAFVVGMGLFIKFCAVHTPSSNPNRPPARKLAELTMTRTRQQPSSAASDIQPITGQGPPHGRRKRSQQRQDSSKRSSSNQNRARVDHVEMRPPPHYDNQLTNDFDRI